MHTLLRERTQTHRFFPEGLSIRLFVVAYTGELPSHVREYDIAQHHSGRLSFTLPPYLVDVKLLCR
jgi:hypothetical protein